jgi:hypothetical protein
MSPPKPTPKPKPKPKTKAQWATWHARTAERVRNAEALQPKRLLMPITDAPAWRAAMRELAAGESDPGVAEEIRNTPMPAQPRPRAVHLSVWGSRRDTRRLACGQLLERYERTEDVESVTCKTCLKLFRRGIAFSRAQLLAQYEDRTKQT